MLNGQTAATNAGCPSREAILAYAAGKLPTEALNSVATHIDSCPVCQSSLEAVESVPLESDSLVSILRRCVAVPPLLEQSGEASSEKPPHDAREPMPSTISNHATLPLNDKAPPSGIGQFFGPYELLEVIGEGGMGIVYKARQIGLDRVVAVKRIRAGASAGPQERQRFRAEGLAMGRMNHANIVAVYDIGEVVGELYLSMQYVEGGNLAKWLPDKGMPLRQAAQVVKKLAEATQTAHERNVIHRDLKPTNVLMTTNGEPKISDFGLAKLQDTDATRTATDAIMGTPCYMPPEQAEGKVKEVGPLVDVYALGAILYELMTGHPPFKGKTKLETIHMLCNQVPVPPTRLRREISPDLEAICLRCLEKKPQKRYGSAGELARDLGRWLNGESTVARPLPGYVIVWRRLPKRIIAAGLVVFGIIAGLILYFRPPDPDAPVKAIEARLAEGEKVTLIRSTGKPAWWRCRIAEKAVQTSISNDGVFTVSSWGRGCLELVRDPQVDHYVLSAEVRHEKADVPIEVGLFCSFREYPLGDNTAYFYVHLCYDDIVDRKKIHEAQKPLFAPGIVPPSPPKGNPIMFGAYVFRDGKAGPWEEGIGNRIRADLVQPAGPLGDHPWRRLTLDVSRIGVKATWAEGADSPVQQVGELRAEQINKDTKEQLVTKRLQRLPVIFPGAIAPEFDPRGSCGLFVEKSVASFRNVVLEPVFEKGREP